MTDAELIAKTAELKACAQRINALALDLARDGCRVEVDVLEHAMLSMQPNVPVVSVKVLREVVG